MKPNFKLGCFRVAMVLLPTLILVVLGFGIAHAIAPSAGDTCSARNATTHDSQGRTLWCSPQPAGTHVVVWQYVPLAQAR